MSFALGCGRIGYEPLLDATGEDGSTPQSSGGGVHVGSSGGVRDATKSGGSPEDGSFPDGSQSGSSSGISSSADATVEASCSTNLLTDAHNCGRCGRDCQGGACTAGTCAPVAIGTTTGGWGIAADGVNVYWTDEGGQTVRQRPAAGGTTLTLSTGEVSPRGIGVDSTYVYWLNFSNVGNLRRVPIGGGTVQTVLPNVTWGEHLALDSNNLYWPDESSATSAIDTALTGGGAITSVATSQKFPFGIALDSTDVFWTCDASNGGVYAAPKSSGAVRTVIPSLTTPTAVAVYGSNVFVAVNGAGTIVEAPTAGGTPMTLASGEAGPYAIAVDADGVYWADQGDNTVRMLAQGSSTPVTLSTSASTVEYIATDATAVYWTTTIAVMRITK